MEGGDDTSCKKMSSVRVTPPDQTEVKLFFSSLLCALFLLKRHPEPLLTRK